MVQVEDQDGGWGLRGKGWLLLDGFWRQEGGPGPAGGMLSLDGVRKRNERGM